MAKNKTVCPVSREEFEAQAKLQLPITLDGTPMAAIRHKFSTGSLGWMMNGPTTIMVGDVPVKVQIGMNITIVGSKDLPQEAPAVVKAPAKAGKK